MKLLVIVLLGTICTQETTARSKNINKSKYEELMLATEDSDKITEKNNADKSGQLWQSQNRGFPDRLLLPRGWTEGMPMQLFTMVTPVAQESVSRAHPKPSRRKIQKCSPDGKAYGFPFDRLVENELTFRQPNMFFKDVKIYHDEDYLLKNFREARQYEKV